MRAACARLRRICWASTISRRSGPRSARRARRCATCTRSRSSGRGERIVLTVCANAFLHHMVRNIAGVLIAIGSGERPTDWAAEVLAARDRTKGGVTAPPGGLYLAGIRYTPEPGLAERAGRPHFLPTVKPTAYRCRSHDLVRKNHAFADQDRAPHALGPGRLVDEMRRLRRGAVPRRAGAQPARLPEVRQPHAHRRARAARILSGSRRRPRSSARRSSRRIRSSSATRRSTATACCRPRRARRRRTRWS